MIKKLQKLPVTIQTLGNSEIQKFGKKNLIEILSKSWPDQNFLLIPKISLNNSPRVYLIIGVLEGRFWNGRLKEEMLIKMLKKFQSFV